MEGQKVSHRAGGFVLALGVSAVVTGGTMIAQAGPSAPTRLNVDLHSAAGLAPDGHSVSVPLLARCPLRWTVVRTEVTVSQSQAAGTASFPLTCTDQYQSFTVTVQSSDVFQLGQAEATALVVIRHGRTEQTQDSQTVHVQPTVFVDLAQTAQLGSGGQALLIRVTVACPVGSNGQQSYVNVSQGQASGNGFYVPVCDGQIHAFAVKVLASRGFYQRGTAQGLTFADVEAGGIAFTGVDENPVQIM